MANLTFTPPADGAAVTMQNGRLCVPDRPVIPFIIGDGTGPEIWAADSLGLLADDLADIDPNAPTTREEAAAMVYRLMSYSGILTPAAGA